MKKHHSNDNTINRDYLELVSLCRSFRQRTGLQLLRGDGKSMRHRAPSTVANFLWFCKVEVSFHDAMKAESRKKTRAKLRVVGA